MMRHNGQTAIGAEPGKDYGIADIGGTFPPSAWSGTGARPPSYAPCKIK
ncbi:MAG: hypothetical protein P8Y58_09270 [Novosphingobium sp.]